MLDVQTQSSMTTFAECPTKYKYSYIDLIKPRYESLPMWYGSLGHKCLSLLYRRKGKEIVPTIAAAVAKAVAVPGLSPQTIQEFSNAGEMLEASLRAYATLYKEEIRGKGNLVFQDSEIKYKYPIKFGTYSTNYLTGEIDMVFKSRKTDVTYIMENKFPGQISSERILEYGLSPQTLHYLMGYMETKAKQDERVGILYTFIRRPQLRQRKTESVESFIRRVKEDMVIRPDFYFHRELVRKSAADILILKQEIIKQMRTMEMVEGLAWWYKNRRACNAKGKCSFFDICAKGDTKQVMAMYVRKAVPHEELV